VKFATFSFYKNSMERLNLIILAALTQARLVTKHGPRDNTDSDGNYQHPFLRSEHEVDVDAIHYPDVGAFSVKLQKTQTANYNKHAGNIIKEHLADSELQYKKDDPYGEIE
jgi:hypothetical protein